MHGIFSSYEGMDDLVALIKAAHPGTDVYNIDAYNDAVSIYRDYPWSAGVLFVEVVYSNPTTGTKPYK